MVDVDEPDVCGSPAENVTCPAPGTGPSSVGSATVTLVAGRRSRRSARLSDVLFNADVRRLRIGDTERVRRVHDERERDALTLEDVYDEPFGGFPPEYESDETATAYGDYYQLQPRTDGSRRPIGAIVTNRDEWIDALTRALPDVEQALAHARAIVEAVADVLPE